MAPPPNTPSDKPLILHARYQAPPPPSETTIASTTSTTNNSTATDPSTAAVAPQHRVFTHPLPSSLSLNRGSDSPTNRTAYLSDLRAAVATMQDEINIFLTARMDEDSRRVAGAGAGGGSGERGGGREAKEKKEEEDYGEEVVDED